MSDDLNNAPLGQDQYYDEDASNQEEDQENAISEEQSKQLH